MGANSFTIVSNDPRGALVGGGAHHEMREGGALGGGETKIFLDELGEVAAVGRGESDLTITYLRLQRGGVSVYIFPNAAGDGVVAQTAKP